MKTPKLSSLLAVLIATAAMVACGGGRGSGSTTFTGVAASGAAIAAGAVQVVCKSGSGNTTTNSDGSYSVTLSGAAELPCLLQATNPINSDTFHSMLAQGATTANITPVTSLIVGNTLGQDPATAFAAFAQSPALQAKVTKAQIEAATTRVNEATGALLAGLAIQDPFTASLVAATSNGAGNALDNVIDALMSALTAADKTLKDLTARLLNITSAEDTKNSVSTLVSEAQYALKNCPPARSGNIWMVELGQEARQFNIRFDQNRLRDINDPGNPVDYAITPNQTVACAYSAVMNGKTREFRVSDSGLAVWQETDAPNGAFGVSLPYQPSVIAELTALKGLYSGLLYIEAAGSRLAWPYRFEISDVSKQNGGTAMGSTVCDLSKPITECSSTGAGLTGPITIKCEELPGRPYGLLKCGSQAAGLEATAVAFNSGSNVSVFVSLSKYQVQLPGAAEPVNGIGFLALQKAPPLTLSLAGSTTAAGQYWNAGKDWRPMSTGFSPTSSPASTVLSVDPATNWFVKSTADSVRTREYPNLLAAGLQLSRPEDPNDPSYSVRVQSPSGWAFSFSSPGGNIANGLYAHIRSR